MSIFTLKINHYKVGTKTRYFIDYVDSEGRYVYREAIWFKTREKAEQRFAETGVEEKS